jgi:hypothetical protein
MLRTGWHIEKGGAEGCMADSGESSASAAGYIVLREVEPGHWHLVGEVDRRPGLTARRSRVQAIADVINETAGPGDHYAVLPRSEWRVAQQL